MDGEELKRWVQEGRSLEQIGRLVGRSPSTVSYWLQRYGLEAPGRERHAPRGALDRGTLAALVARDLTVAQIAAEIDRSQTTVRYWLTFHGLRTTRAARRQAGGMNGTDEERTCAEHGQVRHVRSGGRRRCARCASEAVSAHRRAVKRALVAEAGGACAACGYDRCVAAFQFHHVDPAEKRFALALKGLTRSVDTLRQEAAKCVLLCANCHAEVESDVTSLPRPDRG